MLYTIFIALILVACVLVILAILVQSPKSGMAANFGASNQVMGVRQTSDFLEKFTWIMAVSILALSLLATVVMDGSLISRSNSEISRDAEAIMQMQGEQTPAIPQVELPAEVEAEEVAVPAEE